MFLIPVSLLTKIWNLPPAIPFAPNVVGWLPLRSTAKNVRLPQSYARSVLSLSVNPLNMKPVLKIAVTTTPETLTQKGHSKPSFIIPQKAKNLTRRSHKRDNKLTVFEG